MHRRHVLAVALMFMLGSPLLARAQAVDEIMTTAWEALWQQTGYPLAMRRWGGPLRVGFSGAGSDRDRDYAVSQVKLAAAVVGIEVSRSDDAPNVEVVFEVSRDAMPYNSPCNTANAWREGVITRSRITVNPQSVYRCMLHEAMHLMGFPGHPMHNTVLTYFARGTSLTAIDKRLLKTLYSEDATPGMSPFAFLVVLARHVESDAAPEDRTRVRAATQAFFARTFSEMEAFAGGSGEPPAVLYRSSKASGAGVARGQTEIQFFLGEAYLNGHGVTRDPQKAVWWLTKAAESSHANAQRLLKRAALEAKP